MTFGETLKRIRNNKGLLQRQVARRMGVDNGRFSRLENDRTGFKPSLETVERVAQALDATDEERAELLTAAGRLDQEIESLASVVYRRPIVTKLLRLIVQLPQNQIEELLEQVERNFHNLTAEAPEGVSASSSKSISNARRKTHKH